MPGSGSSIAPTVVVGATLIGAVVLLGGCNDSGPAGPDYEPTIPTEWAATVDNVYFPLLPGTRFTYEGETGEGTETVIVEVLEATRPVYGVEATVVRDRVYVDGELVEDTDDWFAQDAAGNVWYLGEESKEIEDGEVVSTEGSWEWGVDGALPGIIMWADPSAHIGEEYRQEYYAGEAEDWGKVVAVNEAVTTPWSSFTSCVRTEDWNALESGSRENKWYCPQVGFVRETPAQGGGDVVELVEISSPP